MKRGDTIFHKVLFGLLAVFFVLVNVQIFPNVKLSGNIPQVEPPTVSIEAFCDGSMQAQLERYAGRYFGSRNVLVKTYNQYLWDFYKKYYVDFQIRGKDGWLYNLHHVDDYYGREMYKWQATSEEARAYYDKTALRMNKLRGVLKDFDIEFLAFFAPDKAYVYPEFLPEQDHDTLSVSARAYFSSRFNETGFPYLDMTEYFLQIRDTSSYYLFNPTGVHWNFSAVYGVDTLFSFMERLKGIDMVDVGFGPFHAPSEYRLSESRDAEGDFNLWRPMKVKEKYLPLEAELTFSSNDTTDKPSVLFVGNSFLWQMIHYVPPKKVFSDFNFWYYNQFAYSGLELNGSNVDEVDHLNVMLDSDFIVFFTTGSQLYKGTYGFVNRELVLLCTSDEERRGVIEYLMDSLSKDTQTILSYADLQNDTAAFRSRLRGDAYRICYDNIEYYFPSLAGEEVPAARNPKALERCEIKKVTRQIKRDAYWVEQLEKAKVIFNTNLQGVMETEAQNVLEQKPLMVDMPNWDQKVMWYEGLVEDMKTEMNGKPDMVKMIQEKAEKKGISYEASLDRDARWMITQRITTGKIVLPD